MRKLLRPMVAGMPSQNGFQSPRGLILCLRGIVKKALHSVLHLFIIGYKSKVPLAKECFGVQPGRGDQRNAARQRFKDSDRRDTGHGRAVLPARNVNRQP